MYGILPCRFVLVLCLSLLSVMPSQAAMTLPKSSAGLTLTARQSLPAKLLRGYGSLQGEFAEYTTADKSQVSALLITCAGAEHAALTLGKYLSDLGCLGGVAEATVTAAGKNLPLRRVDGQGLIVALRQAEQVAIIAAEQESGLTAAIEALAIDRNASLDFVGSETPMYLDRYDKYGWHFYFNPWLAPKDQPNYDLDTSFQYLSKERLGMVLPLSLNNLDSTEGVIDYDNLAWAIDRGRELNIPTFIQAWAIGAPRMLINRYPYDTMLYAPQFVGNFYGPGENSGGYPPEVAWSSEQAEDTLLSWLQPIYRRYAKYPNVTGYAEPHGEIEHGTSMLLTEYGPVADAAFRRFLEAKYGSPAAVDKRWSAGRGMVRSWQDVRVPEVAEFLGWNQDALDVGGRWQFAYDKELTAEQLADWAAEKLDDQSWQSMIAPGDDHPRFRNERSQQRVPAVFRRAFALTEAQRGDLLKKGEGKCYLYIWTLARSTQPIEAAINGVKVGEYPTRGGSELAWCVFEVSGALRAGENLLALHLPWSELSYRIYLSPTRPRCYPDLGPEANAHWVDFSDFVVSTRDRQVRKGMETIRREDPDKPIKLMAPGGMIDFNKMAAEDFGGVFHDTGSMSSWWNDYLPSLMRSSGMPFTIEAGNGAPDLPTLKLFAGHWMTEGINCVDYFQNLGEIVWDPAQKAWFEANRPLIHLFGKYHSLPASVAVMYSGRSDRLGGFPWYGFRDQPFGLMDHAFSRMQLESQIPKPRDVLLDTDFPRGTADKYRVVIDAGTVVMEPPLVDRIEEWVRRGGIFVAYGQTGRHTPEIKDAWPFARLSGYRVVAQGRGGQLSAAADQNVFTGAAWAGPVNAGGMALEPMAADCQTLLTWQDGTPAVGMRKVGKGYVICMPVAVRGMLDDVLRWSGTFTERLTAAECHPVQYVSNNGLYRIYILWADHVKNPTTTSLVLPGAAAPKSLRNIVSGTTLTGVASDGGMMFGDIEVAKDDICAYIAPRGQITQAPLDWLSLQRDWWSGTVKPAPAPPTPKLKNTIPLDEDWAFLPLEESADGQAYTAAKLDDKDWKRINLGIWNVQGFPNARRGVFRKEIEIPADWSGNGRIWVWLAGSGETLRPPYKVKFSIDGEVQWTSRPDRYTIMVLDLTDKLPSGKRLLSLEMEGTGKQDGVVGDMWIEFVPDPVFSQSLAGDWGHGIKLPGKGKTAGAKRTFVPDPRGKDLYAVLYIDGQRAEFQGVYINGKYVYFYGGPRGHHRRMTLNPWLKYGEENEIELRQYYEDPMDVSTVEIRYYRADQW